MDEVNNKSRDRGNIALSVVGIIFLIIGAVVGGIPFFEVISALVANDSLGLALMIFVIIIYGGIGMVTSIISIVLNGLAYKRATSQKKFKLIILILSIAVAAMILASFVIWLVAAKA